MNISSSMRKILRSARVLSGLVIALPLFAPKIRAEAPPGRYETTADAVLDTATGLTWQRDSIEGTWAQATEYCASLVLGGESDWRIPNIKELQTLRDESKVADYYYGVAVVDSNAFPDTATSSYWSSSVTAGDPNSVWYVDFLSGNTNHTVRLDDVAGVRCVR